jgi:formylglycine-generating enzyme required for sulfatase activity
MGSCDGRVVRGGSWGHVANRSRNSNRDGFAPSKSDWNIGFRLARSSV